MIHSRDAFAETFEIIKHYPDLTFYFHCRGYGPDEINQLLEIFPKIFFGFDGNSSYPKSDHLRASARLLPKEKILIETDAPYLSPEAFR